MWHEYQQYSDAVWGVLVYIDDMGRLPTSQYRLGMAHCARAFAFGCTVWSELLDRKQSLMPRVSCHTLHVI